MKAMKFSLIQRWLHSIVKYAINRHSSDHELIIKLIYTDEHQSVCMKSTRPLWEYFYESLFKYILSQIDC